jgi:hypothetical protein
MATPSSPSSDPRQTPIPEDLRKQLADFQRSLWRIKITEAVLAGIFGLIFSFLLVFAIERQIELPALVRLGILIAGTSLAAIFAPYWVRRWVYGHRREEQLARLISRKFPRLGDRLLGIVELQDQDEAKESLSPELRAAAMVHVANQAAKRDMNQALPYSRHKKLALGVVLGTAAIVFGFVIAPKAGENALKRWLMPLSDTEHYTFTQFDVDRMPDPMIVAIGEPFTFEAPLKEDSDKKPATARARFGLQEWKEAKLGEDGVYRFEFKQDAQGKITVEAGDASHQVKVEPLVRPETDGFTAVVNLPDYLQLDPRNVDLRTGSLTTVEGSTVTLEGNFSRELSSAKARLMASKIEEDEALSAPAPDVLEPEDLEKSEEGEVIPEPKETIQLVEMPKPYDLDVKVSGKSIKLSPIELGHFNAEVPVTWTDQNGLEGASSFTVQLKTAPDMPPSCYTQGLDRLVLIPVGQTLEFQILAEDDFGLKEIGLSWRGEFTVPTEGEPAKGSQVFKKGSPSSTQLSETILFSPEAYGITPQRIFLSAYTLDYRPGAERVYSEPISIYIMTKEEEAQLIQQKFDEVIGDLEEAVRREIENLDRNERLDRSKTGEELQKDEARDELAESEDKEAENTEQMKEIAKKMEEIFKQAANNGEIDPKTMKKMADALKDMKEMAESEMPEVQKKLNDAQEQNSTPEKTKKDLKEAIEKQKDIVEKMKETIQKANQAKENFEASTFINRLKKAASDEGAIVSSLVGTFINKAPKKDFLPSGSTPGTEQSDPAHERLLGEINGRQSTLTNDVRWIMEDLERFFARTQKPIHKELVDEMKGSLIDEKLEEAGTLIKDNLVHTSARELNKWAKKLKEWATKLEGDKDENGDGGGGGGGGSQEEKDFEFMLKVMRMVQAEQNIRGRTRSLEQMRRSLKLTEE